MADETKYTLLTNISFIQFAGKDAPTMRLDCHAILLEEGIEQIFSQDHKLNCIRGFGADAAWPVFTYWLPKEGPLTYTVAPAEDRSVMMLGNGKEAKPKPIFRGCTLAIADGPTFFVQIEDEKHPLDVYIPATSDNQQLWPSISKVWYELQIRCARYWQAPYMPTSSYGPPQDVIARANAELRRDLAEAERRR